MALSLSCPFNQGHVFPLPSLKQHQGFAQCTGSKFGEPKWPENKIVVFWPASVLGARLLEEAGRMWQP